MPAGCLTVGSQFSIGCELGLERAGMKVIWQVEFDPFCQQILQKHWPEVTRYGDIRTVKGDELEPVDLICGGPPCQPHSVAGMRKASADERNLWPEMFGVICATRPRWVVVENVPGLLSSEAGRFFGGILRDLAQGGYCVGWRCISASESERRMKESVVQHARSGLHCGAGRHDSTLPPSQRRDTIPCVVEERLPSVLDENPCWAECLILPQG